MDLVAFQVSGNIKEINRKIVGKVQKFYQPSCFRPLLSKPKGAEYCEIVLEIDYIQPSWNYDEEKIVKLVFFDTTKEWKKQFLIGEKYLFYCTASKNYYWPHNWKKLS